MFAEKIQLQQLAAIFRGIKTHLPNSDWWMGQVEIAAPGIDIYSTWTGQGAQHDKICKARILHYFAVKPAKVQVRVAVRNVYVYSICFWGSGTGGQ